jgi:DMSO/TMAO reductase YedYZ molybdopterin-dependent catalytic subunit
MNPINRRRFLYLGAGSLSAAMLAACDSQGPKAARPALKWAERRNESVERVLFRHTSMDTPDSRHLAGRAMPSYFVSPRVPVWDEAARGRWTLEVTGMVNRPLTLTLPQLMSLPRTHQRVGHYCVEGWTATTEWTGVRLSTLARMAGLKRGAEYVDFQSFDGGYHESWDMESALHRQTLIAYGWEGGQLTPAHGAPARLHSPVKLGYKNVKYLTRIVFMPQRNGGYWTDKGYEWYGGV